MASKINLYECIVNEGTRLLKSNETSDTEKLDENSLADIKNFLNDLRVLNSELFNAPINTNLIDELHKVSDDIKQTYIRKKERRESYKEKRYSFSRHNSTDENQTPSRRKSENGEGYRRRYSGSTESSQSRNLKISISKQKNSNGSLSNVSESVNNDTELNNQRRNSYKRSNSYHSETNYGSFRRRSSGGETGRNSNYNYKHFTRTIPNIKEVFPPGEGPQEQNENKAQTKQNRLSWSGKSTNENQIIEDWRKKNNKGKTIAPA